ncbi:MAG: AAA family ATPase [Bacteroidaceae bacterium]|nr:AAA family ATPase [Bacteroidaceae bacterium]
MPILIFANQKGGVGKSTIATLYANHLSEEMKDVNVLVVDVDFQKSIKRLRNEDLNMYRPSPEDIGYEIEDFNLDTEEKAKKLIHYTKKLCDERPNTVVIFDFPGRIPEEILGRIIYYADYIVCPIQYEEIVMSSTSILISLIHGIKGNTTRKTMLFVPNRISTNEGTVKEKQERVKTNKILANFGTILPSIPKCVDLGRLCTLKSTKRQIEVTKKCFEELDKAIFGEK